MFLRADEFSPAIREDQPHHLMMSTLGEECSHTRGIMATPRCGIAHGEISQFGGISLHGSYRTKLE